MHMQTHTKCPAWGFGSFSVVISPFHYYSVAAVEWQAIKANSNTGKSRKTELLTLEPVSKYKSPWAEQGNASSTQPLVL